MPRKHTYPVRVYIEDTDAGGIVYYANYLKFAERARTEMLRDENLLHSAMIEKDQLFLAVRRCEIEFEHPARLDDLLAIETEIEEIAGARLRLRQSILRDGKKLVSLKVEIACVGQNKRPVRLPKAVLAALRSYQPSTMEKV